jgi:AcrR family transcriptional regulator
VLETVLEEFARVGYAALSIEEIAIRAGVNKTTIYRRWPTKNELVHAACLEVANEVTACPDTGSLRGDLFELLRAFRDLLATPRGQSLMRMILAEGGESEIARLARTVRDTKDSIPKRAITRAIQRGELPHGSDPDLILRTLTGALEHQMLFLGEHPNDRQLAQQIELVLTGAAQGGARRSLRPVKPR